MLVLPGPSLGRCPYLCLFVFLALGGAAADPLIISLMVSGGAAGPLHSRGTGASGTGSNCRISAG
jgi:hypothetical protein